MVLIDHLYDHVHETTRIYGVHDSGAYQDIPPYDTSYTPFGEQCRMAYSMYQPPISEKCASLHEDTWPCVCATYILPHMTTPSQVLIYLYDSYQLNQKWVLYIVNI